MGQITMSIRIDETLKKQLDTLCSEFGMNTSTAFTIFAKTLVRERRIPFEISASADPFYSKENQARLRKSIDALNSGKGTVHELIEDDYE
jgi:DNA-damage-inducible protein J